MVEIKIEKDNYIDNNNHHCNSNNNESSLRPVCIFAVDNIIIMVAISNTNFFLSVRYYINIILQLYASHNHHLPIMRISAAPPEAIIAPCFIDPTTRINLLQKKKNLLFLYLVDVKWRLDVYKIYAKFLAPLMLNRFQYWWVNKNYEV